MDSSSKGIHLYRLHQFTQSQKHFNTNFWKDKICYHKKKYGYRISWLSDWQMGFTFKFTTPWSVLRLGPPDFGFLDPDPDPQKYADPRIRIQVVKNQPKTVKKISLLKPKSELLKKRNIKKISSFLNGSSSLRIKISEKNKQKFENYFLFSKS